MSSSTSDSDSAAPTTSSLTANSNLTHENEPTTVLIIGGGIAGLIAGLSLCTGAGVGVENVHIYEQQEQFCSSLSGETTFLISEQLRSLLDKLPATGLKCARTVGRQVLADDDGYVRLTDSREQEYVSWSSLHSALLQCFPAENYHAGCKVVCVDNSHPDVVVIETDSGERIAGHLLVAADGVGSPVRHQLLPDCQPSYSGYLAWRGIAHIDRLSPEAQHLLADKGSLYKGVNLHVLVHPLPMSEGCGEGQPLAWTWFNNQLEEELPGLLLDQQLAVYPHAVPLGKLSSAVADAVAAAAVEALPEPLAELVAESTASMSVSAVYDMALPCQAVGRVAFVGESGCIVRPHGSSSVDTALQDALSLAEAIRAAKLSIERALPVWDAQQVAASVAMCRAAAAAGNRLQGTEEC